MLDFEEKPKLPHQLTDEPTVAGADTPESVSAPDNDGLTGLEQVKMGASA